MNQTTSTTSDTTTTTTTTTTTSCIQYTLPIADVSHAKVKV